MKSSRHRSSFCLPLVQRTRNCCQRRSIPSAGLSLLRLLTFTTESSKGRRFTPATPLLLRNRFSLRVKYAMFGLQSNFRDGFILYPFPSCFIVSPFRRFPPFRDCQPLSRRADRPGSTGQLTKDRIDLRSAILFPTNRANVSCEHLRPVEVYEPPKNR